MLRHWDSHKNYQFNLRLKLAFHFSTQKSRINKLDRSISKLYLLNLDSLLPVIKPLYSDFGRPAKNQQGIIRSIVLMLDRQNYSITNWAGEVACDPLLFDLCGFEGSTPSVDSYYGFLISLSICYGKCNHASVFASLATKIDYFFMNVWLLFMIFYILKSRQRNFCTINWIDFLYDSL